MTPTPVSIAQAGPDRLRIEWQGGHESVYPVRLIRLACRCAHCIDERTGAPLLRADSVPADVRPVRITGVGRYAIAITWSDGHDTGIYTFENLRELCPCCEPAAQAAK